VPPDLGATATAALYPSRVQFRFGLLAHWDCRWMGVGGLSCECELDFRAGLSRPRLNSHYYLFPSWEIVGGSGTWEEDQARAIPLAHRIFFSFSLVVVVDVDAGHVDLQSFLHYYRICH